MSSTLWYSQIVDSFVDQCHWVGSKRLRNAVSPVSSGSGCKNITSKKSSLHFHSHQKVFKQLVQQFSGVIILDEFLHGLNAALANVPEVLLQRGLDGTVQGWILCNQHLCYKAEHFTFLVVNLKDKQSGTRTKYNKVGVLDQKNNNNN